MSVIFTIIHIVTCISLILVILMQAGKGAGMGAAFGGSSQTVFGSAGSASFLVKVTRILALVFFVTSLAIIMFSGNRASTSTMSNIKPPAQSQAAPEASVPTTPIQNGTATPQGGGK